MSEASVRLRLETGDTLMRLAKMARDSDAVRSAWRGLPSDLKDSHRQMMALGRVQVQNGHLRRRERLAAREHIGHIRREREAIGRNLVQLTSSIAGHDRLRDYYAAQADGTLASQVRRDSGLADLHHRFQRQGELERHEDVLHMMQATYRQHGITGQFNADSAASYWGRRGLFGAGPGGRPLTAGQWASDGARRTMHGLRRGARGAAALFAGFSGIQMVMSSMQAFEARAELVQSLGAQMGNGFEQVGKSLDRLRERYKFTRAELGPGFEQLVRLTGGLEGAGQDARFARSTGMAPAQVMGIMANASQFGQVDRGLLAMGLSGSGMRGRPEAYLSMFAGAQGALGRGYYSVPGDAALRYVAGVAQMMGTPYQGPRGRNFLGRLIGGVQAAGGGMTRALKLSAIRDLGQLDLGGGIVADTNTYRGMRMAMESGDPRVLEAYYREAVRQGGTGELGEEFFQKLTGLNAMESTRLFRGLGQADGALPTAAQLRARGRPLTADLEAVSQTEGYRHAAIRADVEGYVHEPLGRRLVHISEDFKEAAIVLVQGLSTATSAVEALQAIQAAARETGPGASDPLTPWVRDTLLALTSNSGLGALLKVGGANLADGTLSEGLGEVLRQIGGTVASPWPSVGVTP